MIRIGNREYFLKHRSKNFTTDLQTLTPENSRMSDILFFEILLGFRQDLIFNYFFDGNSKSKYSVVALGLNFDFVRKSFENL